MAAGSLLGTLLAQSKSYPVGMMNLLELHPLSAFDQLSAFKLFVFNTGLLQQLKGQLEIMPRYYAPFKV